MALLLITAFGIACLIFGIFDPKEVDASYEIAADERKAIRAEVDRAQSMALEPEKLNEAIQSTAASLLFSKEAATKPAQPAPAAQAAQPEPASE
ncbi:hypothetical protein N9891_00825 [bacterium]|nr:hypothetical protein [bacterium]